MIKNALKFACLLASFSFVTPAFAYNAGSVESGCKDPRFKTFHPEPYTPEHKVEVDPESEISFTVSGYADPSTIRAKAKNTPLKLTIVDKNSFYDVSAKLPASLTGKYARIHLKANNTPECKAKDGWLVKIRKSAAVVPEAAEVVPETNGQTE